MKPDESDQDETDEFLAELLGTAKITEADVARLLTVSSFNIHRYIRNAPIVKYLDVMKQVAALVGKQVMGIYWNDARTRYIPVQVVRYLADCFDAHNLNR